MAIGSRILLTPGTIAEQQVNTLNLLICFPLLFYTVESPHKERNRRMDEIFNAAPVGTGAMLLGRTMGNAAMAGLILLAALLAGVSHVDLDLEIEPGSATRSRPAGARWCGRPTTRCACSTSSPGSTT